MGKIRGRKRWDFLKSFLGLVRWKCLQRQRLIMKEENMQLRFRFFWNRRKAVSWQASSDVPGCIFMDKVQNGIIKKLITGMRELRKVGMICPCIIWLIGISVARVER